ncbi:MAG: hypothetical protein V4537_08440 [Pseudomonadota bacterium]
MFKLFSIFAVPAVVLAAAAGVAAEPTKSFKHDGVTYVYEATLQADGSTLLSGHTLPNGAKFRLVVKDGQVTGEANRQPVNFTVAGSRGASRGAVAMTTTTRVSAAD